MELQHLNLLILLPRSRLPASVEFKFSIKLVRVCIDIINPDGRATHFLFGSSGQNYIRGPVNTDLDALRFGSRISNFLRNLWSTNEYGFGVNSGMLRYNSMDRHTFFSGGVERINLNSLGVISCGGISANTTGYIGGNLTMSATSRIAIGDFSPGA